MPPPSDSDRPPLPPPLSPKRGSSDWLRLDSGESSSNQLRPQPIPRSGRSKAPDTVSPEASNLARPAPVAARLAKPRRKLLNIVLAVALLVLAVLGWFVGLWFRMEAGAARRSLAVADSETQAAKEQLRIARLAEADTNTAAAVLATEHGDAVQALLLLANAIRLAHAEGDAEREQVNRIRFRDLARQLPGPVQMMAGLPAGAQLRDWALHPSGRWALLQDEERVHLWDMKEEVELKLPEASHDASAAAWSNDGAWLALATPKQGVFLSRFPGTEPPIHIEFPGQVRRLRFNKDGKLLAMGGDRVRIWNCEEKQFVDSEFHWPPGVVAFEFNPNGDRLVGECSDGTAYVFALANGRFLQLFQVQCVVERGTIRQPLLFADGGRLLVGMDRNRRQALAWDISTGKIRFRYPNAQSDHSLHCVAVSPNGRLLAIGADEGVAIFDVSTGAATHSGATWWEHFGVQTLAFSPDSRLLISGGSDSTVKFWSLVGKESVPSMRWPAPATGLAFWPDDRHLVAVQNDGFLSVWKLPPDSQEHFQGQMPARTPVQVIPHPDDKHFIVCGTHEFTQPLREARVFDSEAGKVVSPPLEATGHVLHAALSPTHPWAALAVITVVSRAEREKNRLGGPAGSHLLEVWNWQTGKRLYEPIALAAEPRAVAFHPEGRSLAVLTGAGQVQLFDPATGKRMGSWSYPQHITALAERRPGNGGLAFSPDGQSVLTWGIDNTLRVWDAHSGKERFALQQGDGVYHDIAFSPDIRRLATCHSRGDVALWNFATGEPDPDAKFPPHSEDARSVQFVADGKHLLLAGRDGQVRLWDWRAGQQVGIAMTGVAGMRFARVLTGSPWLVTVGNDRRPRIWDSRTGLPVTFALTVSSVRCGNCTVLRSGRTLISAYDDGSIRAFDLEEMLRPNSLATSVDAENDSLTRMAQLLSGHEFVEPGVVQPLSSERWARVHREMKRATANYGE